LERGGSVIVLIKPQLATLIARGRLEVWSPFVPAPTLGQTHEVRTRRDGDAVTWARKAETRQAKLGDLTYPEALAAGFKTRDDFRAWFAKRYAQHQGRATVMVWELVAEEPGRYLSRPVSATRGDRHLGQRKGDRKRHTPQGDYSLSPVGSVDELEPVDRAAQARITEQAKDHDELREKKRRDAWERLTLRERVAELETLRHFSEADISRELRLANHALRRAWEKLDRDGRAA
jgi:hypothetical protein